MASGKEDLTSHWDRIISLVTKPAHLIPEPPPDDKIIQQIADELCETGLASCQYHVKVATDLINQIKQYYKIGASK